MIFCRTTAVWIFDREETEMKRRTACFLMALVMALSLVANGMVIASAATVSGNGKLLGAPVKTMADLKTRLTTAKSGDTIVVISHL